MIPVNEFFDEVTEWLRCNEMCHEGEGTEDIDPIEPQTEQVQVEPYDSISNIASNTSSKHSRSTLSDFCRQVEAEQAANIA